MQEEDREGENVNELECLNRALGMRHTHTCGVGMKPTTNIDLFPN